MDYHYDYRPIDDLLIAAGVDLLPVIKAKAENDLNVSQISEEAFDDLESDYKVHASQVMNPKYGQYLKLVDENMGLLRTNAVSSKARKVISDKLYDLVDLDYEDQKFQAKTFPKISKFLHKLGQLLFKSHRFQTKREHGLQLVAELGNVEPKILKKELENLIKGRKSTISFKRFMRKVNALDEPQFQELLKVYYKSHLSSGPKYKRFEFFENLTPEKKEMVSELYENGNWYFRVFDILKGRTDEEIDEYISENMIDWLTSNVNQFFAVWSYERYHDNDPVFEKFVELVVVRAVVKCLEEGDDAAIQKFISDREFGPSVRIMLHHHLSQEEKNRINFS